MAPLTAVQLRFALVVVMPEADNPEGVPQEEPEVMVKFALEISKKIFPTDSIFTLAVVVGVFGTVITSEPSFAVLATSTVGNV